MDDDDVGEANNCFITPPAFRGVIGSCFSEIEFVVSCLGESTKRRRRPSLKIEKYILLNLFVDIRKKTYFHMMK